MLSQKSSAWSSLTKQWQEGENFSSFDTIRTQILCVMSQSLNYQFKDSYCDKLLKMSESGSKLAASLIPFVNFKFSPMDNLINKDYFCCVKVVVASYIHVSWTINQSFILIIIYMSRSPFGQSSTMKWGKPKIFPLFSGIRSSVFSLSRHRLNITLTSFSLLTKYRKL